MSQLSQQFWSRIGDFLGDRIDLAELREWLAAHVQDIADAGDDEVEDIDGLLWTLISENDYGHRSVTEIKAILRAQMPQPAGFEVR